MIVTGASSAAFGARGDGWAARNRRQYAIEEGWRSRPRKALFRRSGRGPRSDRGGRMALLA